MIKLNYHVSEFRDPFERNARQMNYCTDDYGVCFRQFTSSSGDTLWGIHYNHVDGTRQMLPETRKTFLAALAYAKSEGVYE